MAFQIDIKFADIELSSSFFVICNHATGVHLWPSVLTVAGYPGLLGNKNKLPTIIRQIEWKKEIGHFEITILCTFRWVTGLAPEKYLQMVHP